MPRSAKAPAFIRLLLFLSACALVTACSHPLEIVGEGDILSASGDRDCLLEDYRAGSKNCSQNAVGGDYSETYYAQARPGWSFDHWENYCTEDANNFCTFTASSAVVQQYWGETMPPLRAVFIQDLPDPLACETAFDVNDVFVVDLSEDSETPGACGLLSDDDDIATCVEQDIRREFASTPDCLAAFDVFVPGTNQEDGNYQQFTSILSDTPGRTYLSLQYSYESTVVDDAIQYDKGVAQAARALNHLLYTLEERFPESDVRVFGHSKGADPVARSSLDFPGIKFFSFAQAGRVPSTLRGRAGYMEKLYDNLVTLTWQNDEVKFYLGGTDGLQTPEIWGFPGYINEGSGGLTLYPLRIDHHNNYGGYYTKEDFPYCATGNKSAMVTTSECKKQAGVHYHPWFWGSTECTAMAYDLMDNGSPGDSRYIGYSGPRTANCGDATSTISASYSLVYSLTPADQDDCEYNMEVSFNGLDFGANRSDGSTIAVKSTRDTYGTRKTGSIRVPLHMEIELKAYMRDVSGTFSKCINYLDAKSEGYIHSLAVAFTDPATGKSVSRTLIGNSEGIEYIYPLKMADKNNVAWRKRGGSWDLHFGIPLAYPYDAIMVKGTTGGGYSGTFYKWVHLID